jgi:uncharacterized sulfatase
MKRLRFPTVLFATLAAVAPMAAAPAERPSILWISSEDNGPHLGCYGDRDAVTPHLDALAARGMIYRRVWSVAPVCAPARTAIISGLYPSATGAEHMRSLVKLPEGMRMFPQFLRDAGYYCSNNAKEDYNLEKPGRVWDVSSTNGHWKNRKPGQPFFAVFNHTQSHESQVRARGRTLKHDPARVRLPAYHPDTPEVRRDWAQYHDQVSVIDERAGANLRELEAAGLTEDTIVFYFGDHGPGLPRGKRSACDSGLRVPLIVYFPPKWRHLAPRDYQPGGTSDRLVSFVDFAPTVLSLAGLKPPAWMHGRAFAGKHAAPAPEHLFGLRGRMDERYDLVRSVRDERYVYVRNYLPHRPHGQHVSFMFETPTTQVWKKLYDEGKLPPHQAAYWQPREPEELYDLEADPDEVRNLAASPEHRRALERLRRAHERHMLRNRDVDLLPEAEMLVQSMGWTPYDFGQNAREYPLKKILAAAERAATRHAADVPVLRKDLSDPDSGVRYWAAVGLLVRGQSAVEASAQELRAALRDESPSVRIPAAEALARHGAAADRDAALDVLLPLADISTSARETQPAARYYTAAAALNALDALGPGMLAARREALRALPQTVPGLPQRTGDYVERLLKKILRDLGN